MRTINLLYEEEDDHEQRFLKKAFDKTEYSQEERDLMTGKKEKTISGAMYSAPNLEHNLRTHIPPNSVEERRHLNWVYTKDSEITLQQVYEKLFAKSYKECRDREIKKGRGKRFPPTYYEKIEQDKQKHLCYEIIWQIGDMRDTGFIYTLDDANRA